MTKQEMFAKMEEVGIIPALRASSSLDALFAAKTVFSAGIPIVEVTTTTPAAIEVIIQLVREYPDAIVGAGTVLDVEMALACLEAGAMFLTNTGLDSDLVEFARKHDLPLIPGALTPGEVMLAKKSGAPFIKIYPCANLGGPSYIRALRGPFPTVRLIATGGVSQLTAREYIRAGANVLGIGHDLLPPEAIRTKNADWIHELAHRFLGMVKQARTELSDRA